MFVNTWEHGNITIKNFVLLDEEIQLKILSWRNHKDIRKNMRNSKEILVEEHMAFLESLSQSEDVAYWLVYRKNKSVGVLYMTLEDDSKSNMEWGMYLSPDYLGTGVGFELGYEALHFFFSNYPIVQLNGYVKKDNTENCIMQDKLGFKRVKEREEMIHYVFTREEFMKIEYNFSDFRKKIFYGNKG